LLETAATAFFAKIVRSEKNNFDAETLNLVMYFTPKNLCTICKLVKIDNDEAWKILYQQSSGSLNDNTYQLNI